MDEAIAGQVIPPTSMSASWLTIRWAAAFATAPAGTAHPYPWCPPSSGKSLLANISARIKIA
jgi:hypothetical protein